MLGQLADIRTITDNCIMCSTELVGQHGDLPQPCPQPSSFPISPFPNPMEMFYEIHIPQSLFSHTDLCLLLGITLKRKHLLFTCLPIQLNFFHHMFPVLPPLWLCPFNSQTFKEKEDYTMLFLKHRSNHITQLH